MDSTYGIAVVVVLFVGFVVYRLTHTTRYVHPDDYPTVKWDDIELQTGDLLLFSGHNGDSSYIRSWLAHHYTHVALVVVLSDGNPYLFHANAIEEEIPCVFAGKPLDGVQVNQADLVAKSYFGHVYHLRMGEFTEKQLERLPMILKRFLGRPFNHDLLELFRLAFPNVRQTRKHPEGKLTCAEVLVHVYILLGILPLLETRAPNEIPPYDLVLPGRQKWLNPEQYSPRTSTPPLIRF